MRQIAKTTKQRLLYCCILFLLVFLTEQSCTKVDTGDKEGTSADVSERFFQIPAGTMSEVVRVISYMKSQNRQHNFVNAFVSQQGMPVWNKAILKPAVPTASIGGNGEDTVIVIPFVLNNENLVNGCIKATLNGNISTIAYRRDQYAQLPFAATTTTASLTAEQYAMQMMYMDKYVFGHSTFKVTDRRLFYFHGSNAGDTAATKIVLKDSSNTGNYNTIENCQTIISFHCTGGGQCDKYTGACDLCWRCLSWNTFCSLDIGGEPPLGIPLPSGLGGTGGNGGGTPPGNGGGNPAPGSGSGTGNHGTEPLVDNDYNPYEAQAIILDTSITNNFPCVAKIMDSISTYLNANAVAQVALHQVFNIDKNIISPLYIDWSLTKDSLDGESIPDPNYSDDFIFRPKIRLNPWVLKNATQEYIASTILHEIYHAYIDFKVNQYLNHQIDSTAFKSLFPIYWPLRNQAGQILTPGARAQHNIMANNLINIMAQATSAVNSNSNISNVLRDSINRSIAWGGLQFTTAWKNRSDTVDIKSVILMARDTAVTAPYVYGPNGTIYNNDSHTLHLKKGCQ